MTPLEIVDQNIFSLINRVSSLEQELKSEIAMRKDLRDYCFDTVREAINEIGVENFDLKKRVIKIENFIGQNYEIDIGKIQARQSMFETCYEKIHRLEEDICNIGDNFTDLNIKFNKRNKPEFEEVSKITPYEKFALYHYLDMWHDGYTIEELSLKFDNKDPSVEVNRRYKDIQDIFWYINKMARDLERFFNPKQKVNLYA